MTLSVVASSAQGVINGAALTFTYPTIVTGDIAIVASALTRTGTAGTVTSSNGTSYTQIGSQGTNGNLTLSVWARSLSSAETTATASGTGNAQDGDSFCYTIIRGALFNSIDTSSMGSGTSANPNSPAVTIGSTSALAVSIAASLTTTTVTTLPTNYSSGANATASDTRSSIISNANRITSIQGSEDPAAWTYGASAAWLAVTIGFVSSDSVYYPMPPPWRDPPDQAKEMIGY